MTHAPRRAAPEIISNRRNYDGKRVDVWSAGVMLYVMLFCQYPFERSEDDQEKVPAKRYQMVRAPACCRRRRIWGSAFPRTLSCSACGRPHALPAAD